MFGTDFWLGLFSYCRRARGDGGLGMPGPSGLVPGRVRRALLSIHAIATLLCQNLEFD